MYITGAVKYPGVYKVAAGSHVYDVIHEAGDILPYADTASIDLTEEVVNHMQIVVKTDLAGQGALADGKVNINIRPPVKNWKPCQVSERQPLQKSLPIGRNMDCLPVRKI